MRAGRLALAGACALAASSAAPALAAPGPATHGAGASVAMARTARAAGPEQPRDPLTVRPALSKRAKERLAGLRLLRLLELELDDRTPLSRTALGPLGGEIIRIWIDTPTPDIALIEVRRTDRSLTRRRLAISGFPPDIAARVVAIAASEMVRAQALPPRPPPPEPTPGPAAPARAGHSWGGIATSAAISALWIPASSPELLFGPELGLAHRRGATGQLLYARWLVNSHAAQRMRWFEVGVGADLRVVLPEPSWRLHLGARGGGVALSLPGVVRIDGEPSEPQSWTVRGAALLGIEAHLPDTGWLELSVEPGAMLRSLEAADATGSSRSVGGFALGVNLALHVEAAYDRPSAARSEVSPTPVALAASGTTAPGPTSRSP